MEKSKSSRNPKAIVGSDSAACVHAVAVSVGRMCVSEQRCYICTSAVTKLLGISIVAFFILGFIAANFPSVYSVSYGIIVHIEPDINAEKEEDANKVSPGYKVFTLVRQLVAAFGGVAFGDHTHYNRRSWGPLITCAVFIVDIVVLLVRRPHSCALMNDLTAAMIIMIFPVSWSAMSAASLDDRTSDEPAQLLVRRTVIAACIAMFVLLFASYRRPRASCPAASCCGEGKLELGIRELRRLWKPVIAEVVELKLGIRDQFQAVFCEVSK